MFQRFKNGYWLLAGRSILRLPWWGVPAHRERPRGAIRATSRCPGLALPGGAGGRPGRDLLYLASLGHAYARAGMKWEARGTLARLAQASATRHVSSYHVAAIHVALGETNAGLDSLERAREERSPWIGYIGVDPRFEPVRAHPRFLLLLKERRLIP